MNLRYDIAVIGGDAAGMLAAIKAAEAGAKVVLFEKKQVCGRKMLLTGKGRCNMTNTKPWAEFSSHMHPKAAFVKAAFHNFSNKDTIRFFNQIGLPTVVTQGQRVFPESMSAADVVDVLVSRMMKLSVDILYNCDIIKVMKSEKCYKCIYTKRIGDMMDIQAFSVKAVIVATGGLSYPITGSTGKGYDIARSFEHTVTPCFPSLTALTPKNYDTRLIGIDLENVGIYLTVNGDIVQMETGDISFTDGGIEGSLGYRVSRKAVHAMINGNKVEIVLDLKPALSVATIKARIGREMEDLHYTEPLTDRRMVTLLKRLMPQQLIQPFLFAHKNVDVKSLPDVLKEWRFPIDKYVGYERAVVTAGGVSTEEVVSKTMQSRLSSGLFFAGEVLDVDGDTGGYNLQFAFSSGALAGQSAAKYVKSLKL